MDKPPYNKKERYPRLNLPSCRLRLRSDSGTDKVWDSLRKIWVVATPEEWVRRHVVEYLLESCGIPPVQVRLECPVCVSGQNQRADIVVYDGQGRPLMLIECKAPEVVIDAQVYAQAVRYNSVLGARYIMVTNGISHGIYEKGGEGTYKSLPSFPRLIEITYLRSE